EQRSEPVSAGSMLRAFSGFLRDRGFLAHTGLAVLVFSGLFAWISSSSFVLQDLYHLSSFAFGVAFAIASGGFMTGSALASRYVHRLGIVPLLGFRGTVTWCTR